MAAGALYLFLDEEVYRLFQQDHSGMIARAAAEWKRIEHLAAEL